jgi:hypothetical protein
MGHFLMMNMTTIKRSSFAFALSVNLLIGASAIESVPEAADLIFCEVCQESTPGAQPFVFRNYQTQEPITGFYLPQALLTIHDISQVELLTQEWVVPVSGIAIGLSPSGKKKALAWDGANKQEKLLVLFAGAPRATIKKSQLAIILETEDKLWVAIPTKTDSERRALEIEVGNVNKKIHN